MKAIRIHAYGGPAVLVYEEAPRPEPGPGEVLVRVHAAALNPVDRFTRAGYLQGMVDFALPFTPGLDLAGVVEAIGDNAGELAPKPASLDFVSAAAVPLAGMTAWQGLFDVGGLQAGQTVLIHGAGGGVGSLAVQFAVTQGVRVLATAGSDKIELLRELGVTEAIDYTQTEYAPQTLSRGVACPAPCPANRYTFQIRRSL